MRESMTSPSIHVSGAGPAGLTAALAVARLGGRAVVHERRDDVGSRFHGDFQGIENWSTEDDVLEELEAMGIESTFPHVATHEVTFFDAEGTAHASRSTPPLFYLVRRGSGPGTLDTALKEQALDAGVEIRFGDTRRHLPEGGVVAEGPHGSDAIAVGYTFETDGPDGAWGVAADGLAPEGYAYLLVQDGRGTVASCLFDNYHDEKLYLERTVEFFQREVGLEMSDPRPFGGTGNFRVPRSARRGDILFAGEAAGFQDALWGFGMRYAMISGHLAGRCLVEGDPGAYDRRWKQRLGGLMRAAVVNRYVYERLGDGGYTKFLRRLEGADDPREWLRRRYAPTLFRRLAFPFAERVFLAGRRRAAVAAEAACPEEGCDCTWCRCQREPAADVGRASGMGRPTGHDRKRPGLAREETGA